MRINGGYSFRMHDSQPALASVIWAAAEEKKTFPLGHVCHLHPPSMYVRYLGHRRRNNNIPPPFQLPIVMRNFLTNIWPNSSTVVTIVICERSIKVPPGSNSENSYCPSGSFGEEKFKTNFFSAFLLFPTRNPTQTSKPTSLQFFSVSLSLQQKILAPPGKSCET